MQKKCMSLKIEAAMPAWKCSAQRWKNSYQPPNTAFKKSKANSKNNMSSTKAHFRDLQSKIAVAMGWMSERAQRSPIPTLYENIEEQRQAIQAFEGRMQQWQKVVSDWQELQLLNEESDKNQYRKNAGAPATSIRSRTQSLQRNENRSHAVINKRPEEATSRRSTKSSNGSAKCRSHSKQGCNK